MKRLGEVSFEGACQTTILDLTEEYPEFATLANIALAIPVSSVPCERGFSLQNHIKTSQRSRLTGRNVDNLMLLSMEGPEWKATANCDNFLQKGAEKFQDLKDRDSAYF